MHDAFKALGDPHRLEIVRLALAEPRHVQALADALGISQPAVSRHLGILERAGLVALTRNGRRTEVQVPPPEPAPEILALLRLIASNTGVGGEGPAGGRSAAAGGWRVDAGPGETLRRGPVREEIEDYLL